MRLRYMLIGLVVLLMPLPVSAEFYRYTDERGVIHFTDNFIEIPEDQRPKVEIITQPEEVAPPPQVETESSRTENAGISEAGGEADRSESQAGTQDVEAAAESVQPRQQFEVLIKTKVDLDKIYDALAAETESLEKEQKNLKTVESIRTFQEKVKAFNKKLADYERQRLAFQARADAYNRAITK